MWLFKLFNQIFKRKKHYTPFIDHITHGMMVSGLSEEEVKEAIDNRPVTYGAGETLSLKHFNIECNTTNLNKIFISVRESFTDNLLPFGEGGFASSTFKIISIEEKDLPLYETLPYMPYPSNLPMVKLKS